MAGFMSGFGPAFANAFTQTRRDIEQREDDVFKLKYADFLRTKDERMKTKKEEQQALSQAQQLASDMKDPNAAPFIYKQIVDFGVDDVQKKLQDGRLTFDEGYKPQDVQATDVDTSVRKEMDNMLKTAPGISGVGAKRIDSRLQEATDGQYDSLMQTPKTPYSGVDTGAYGWSMTSENKVETGQLRDAIYRQKRFILDGNFAKAKEEQLKIDAIQEAAQIQAMTEANAEQAAGMNTMSNSWLNTETGEVITGQAAVRNGQQVILAGKNSALKSADGFRQMSMAELKDRSAIRTTAGKKVEEYNAQVGATISMMDISGRLMTMVDQDENVLAQGAGAVSEYIATGVREIDAFNNLIDGLRQEVNKTGQTDATDEMINNAEREFNTIIKSNTIATIQDHAARKKIFDNLRVLLAYRQAESIKSGRFAVQDMQYQLDIITAPTTKEAFMDGLRGILQESISRSYGLETAIENNSELSVQRANFVEQWGYDMYDDSIKSIDFFVDQAKGPSKIFIDLAWGQYQSPVLITQKVTSPSPTGIEGNVPSPQASQDPTEEERAMAKRILEERMKEKERMDKMPGAAGRKSRRE